ncbi:DUF2145 domain-containing protein [Luteimonas panaciterrae]|uniref:DUF2145 domain-containing protein n=1 Tax=Luteimonas panaciterrae TaxID=363885 RepID=UPI001CFB3AF8|nr:DUF2145 domain-containing protein [Luteimonas panaciterrae]
MKRLLMIDLVRSIVSKTSLSKTGLIACAAIVFLAIPAPGHAGTACDERIIDAAKLADAAETALRTAAALDRGEAPMALVARVGTDLSAHGLVYSHIGFALRDHPDGRWTVLHLLNDCGTDRSDLHAQGLVNFFADDLVNQDARIVWLQPEISARLAEHLRALPRQALHQQNYNLIARPGSADYQNSTAWVLETLAVALPASIPAKNRREAYAFVRNDGFTPDRIHISYGKRILGGLFSANVAFTDHSVGTRLSGDYPVVTVRSIFHYLDSRGYAIKQTEWRNGVLQATPGPG